MLLGLHPMLCCLGATAIIGSIFAGLVDEFGMEQLLFEQAYFRDPNAAVPQANILVTFSITASRT